MSGAGLESAPLMEALLLNCAGLNLGLLLNNIWTWFAVVTAAVGFWRIRSLKPDFGPEPDPDQPLPSGRQEPDYQDCPVQTEPDRVASTSTRVDDVAFERVTKGNKVFKAYFSSNYNHKPQEEEEEERENEGGWEDGDWVVVEEWTSRSPAKAAAGGGIGWYSYQDTRVLDGSVVRLWDHVGGCSRRRRWPSLVGVTRSIQECN